MRSLINILLISCYIIKCRSEWDLFWSDEFENQTLDTNKWEIDNEIDSCSGNYIQQINCNTNSSRNLVLIDGSLAITAINEKYLDKDYTSAKITTKQSFTYGRIEIRAALPKGKMLRPAMFMIPTKYTGEWPTDGQIDIMTNIQTPRLGNGVHYNIPQHYSGQEHTTNTSLNNFHTYAIEWSESEIKWYFDYDNHFSFNTSRILGSIYAKNGQPFDSPFKIVIHLGVGGLFFPGLSLTLEDVSRWKCSLLILDYVRIYQWINETVENFNLTDDRISAESICDSVMSSIGVGKNSYKISYITVIATISVIVLLVMLAIIVFLVLRVKTLNKRSLNKDNNFYDDCDDCNDTEVYQTVDYDNIYDKKNQYEEVETDLTRNSNNYYTIQSHYTPSDDIRNSSDNGKRVYLEVTNHYVVSRDSSHLN